MEPLIFHRIAVYKNAIPNPAQVIEAANRVFDRSLHEAKLGALSDTRLSSQPLSSPALASA